MFGDLFNIKEKIEKAKQEVLDTKARLDKVYVEKTSECGTVKVSVTANKQIRNIDISGWTGSNEQLAEVLKKTLNAALQEAGEIQEVELKNAFTKHMPNIPGLDNLF
jgi:DNA-binding protein YbaB